MMSTLAHELRQPLGAIESIAYYLSMILPHDDPKVGEQLNRLQELVEQSDWILSNGVNLAAELEVSAELLDLDSMIREFVGSRGWTREPRLELASRLVRADANLLRALIANLVTLVHQADCVVRTNGGATIELESESTTLGSGGKLSIESAQRIVAAHGGSIAFEADARGLRIRVMLP